MPVTIYTPTIWLVLLLLLPACEPPQSTAQRNAMTTYTVNIDGCSYIAWTTYAGYWNYTHKGNCTNHALRVTDLKQLEATLDLAK